MFQWIPLGYIAANFFHLSNGMYETYLHNLIYSQFCPWLLAVCNPVELKRVKKKFMFAKRGGRLWIQLYN